jgi:hypothetical protein
LPTQRISTGSSGLSIRSSGHQTAACGKAKKIEHSANSDLRELEKRRICSGPAATYNKQINSAASETMRHMQQLHSSLC